MHILDSPSTDPYFNIAAEEYLLKNTDEEFVFLYVNEASIIIGKHQNAYAEVNLPYVMEQHIPVVRRISGGGAVWHDEGNVNFAFILNGQEGRLVNFRQYATPILGYLKALGIPAEFGSRNEILVDGKKVSGNAEHVYRSRVLHHGTLLFSSDLTALQSALRKEPGKYSDRAVQSVQSPVVNIREYLAAGSELSDFRSNLLGHLSGAFVSTAVYMLSEADREGISGLVGTKYSTWAWNFGYSPRYRLTRKTNWEGKTITIELEVEKGKITGIVLSPEEAIPGLSGRLSDILSGLEHEPGQIRERLLPSGLVKPRLIDNFIGAMF